ncbi:2543_t:CDS:2 [Paraglomus occultum]|uniref:2543_t:CDS:1 n=1 Tax=Paraglomus occultum TaxID=144539 RepID=A0A9N9AU15_9GLOM|nr:2543_t:CDS:2 [Paraglomus occultum]
MPCSFERLLYGQGLGLKHVREPFDEFENSVSMQLSLKRFIPSQTDWYAKAIDDRQGERCSLEQSF